MRQRTSLLALVAALAARARLAREAGAVRALAALGPPPGSPVLVSFHHDGLPKDVRFVMSKGNWGLAGANRPQDSFTSKKYKGFLGNAVVPPSSPFVSPLTAPAFTVPVLSTTNVSGGGTALATAVAGAAAGTRLLITDSLDYSVVDFTGKTNITIEADAGQTPTITAAAGASGHCITISTGNSGIHLKGLGIVGNGNQNAIAQNDNGLILGTPVTGFTASTFDRLIVEDCVFTDLTPASGVPGIQLVGTDGTAHADVQVIGCTFTDMSTPAAATGFGYGAVTIGGFGGQVLVQNSKVQRVAVARATSNMRGVVLKNVFSVVQDVLCFDLGTGGSNESFKHNNEAIFGSVVGGVSSWENCVAYNAKRGFRITQPAASMIVSHCTFYNDTAGIAAGQVIMLQSSGAQTIKSCVIHGAGDGTAFSATVTEDHNDVFNVAANGKVLDLSDLTVDPLLNDTPNNDYRATDPAVVAGGVGGDPMGVYYPGGTVIFWAGVP
jgi:hypothetical protein